MKGNGKAGKIAHKNLRGFWIESVPEMNYNKLFNIKIKSGVSIFYEVIVAYTSRHDTYFSTKHLIAKRGFII